MTREEMIEQDLGCYNDNNPAPKSLTIPGKNWRHYELGPIVGFVIYAKEGDEGKNWFGFAEIEEDDGNWFIPDHAMDMSAYWIDSVAKTLKRMVQWKLEHLQIGFNHDNPPVWEETVITPIED
jgi:hypothetical protein